ncbi:hypothetical protein [Shewanella pealeana]|uniref:Uncharacterized protein n=1 Tax=Shewanella pealeana (strain ATCC 700345 / ANG-SQ1) TaxID=398579 RepID=A8H218_SHEPA|nr:hypothetical protein [Shewanella pealeana]ABV86605.1 conserved hypothetical protein [Shewanella pealeana ATCC 700345]
MTYKNEFGTDFELGFNLANYPYLHDKSWHNDLSPSFYFKVNQQYYVLWVDYAELHKREDTCCRYLIQEAINEGNDVSPEIYSSNGSVIFENESSKELEEFLNNLMLNNMQNCKTLN